jgi:hypothetical protein
MNPLFVKDTLLAIIKELHIISDVACLRRTCKEIKEIKEIIDKGMITNFVIGKISARVNTNQMASKIGEFHRLIM